MYAYVIKMPICLCWSDIFIKTQYVQGLEDWKCIELKPELCRIGVVQKNKEIIIEAFEKTYGIGLEMLKGKNLNHELIACRKMLIREILKYKTMS